MKNILLIIFLFSCSTIVFCQNAWTSRGPSYINNFVSTINYGIGRVDWMDINPQDTNTIYIVSHCGTLWKSVNNGEDWIALLDSIGGNPLTSIKIDPVNLNILYATASGHLYKSINAGLTWTELNIGFSLIFGPGTGRYFKLLIDPSNHQNIFLTYTGNGIHKSTDGGTTWNLIHTSHYNDLEMNPLNPNVLYGIDGSNNSVAKSADGGITWTNSNSFTNSISQLSVTIADTNYIYINNSNNQVALSTDGGSTFVLKPSSNNITSDYTRWLENFEVSPVNKNLLIWGGLICSRSDDGGLTWNYTGTSIGINYVHDDNRYLMFCGSSFWSCNDGGLNKSEDGGISWINKTKGLAISGIEDLASSESDSSIFMCAADDDAMQYHAANGWSNIFNADGVDVSIHPFDPQILYGKTQYGFYRSLDGGLTEDHSNWFVGCNENFYGFNPLDPIRFNYQNPNSMYLFGANFGSNLWKSTDKGNHCFKISNFSNSGGAYSGGVGFLYVCKTDSNIIFIPRYHTFNNGLTWVDNKKIVLEVDPDEPNKVWGRSDWYDPLSLYYSADTGTTWIQIPTHDLFLTINPQISIRCANNVYNGIYLFTNHSIYYRDDRFSNWQPYKKGLPFVEIKDMNVLENFGILRVATFGRGIYENKIFDLNQPFQVDFLADKQIVCPNDTIQFYDNSLNNGPGFNPVYHWVFPGGTPAASGSVNPRVSYAASGTYAVSLRITNSFGEDSLIKTSFINVNTPPLAVVPLLENFQGTIFPPANWNTNHQTINPIWSLMTNFGGYGTSTKSLGFINTYLGLPYDEDYFSTPNFNLSALNNPVLYFDYYYGYDYADDDTLNIYYTTDCGLTKQYIYSKFGSNLKTDSASFSVNPGHWKSDTIGLGSLTALGDLQIGFEARRKSQCFIMLDNININSHPGFSIISQPTNVSSCIGTNAIISVSASGTGLTYQWQESTDAGNTFNNLINTGIYSNVSTPMLNITGTTLSLNGNLYRCIVSDGGSNITSNAAVLHVYSFPMVTVNSDTICQGQTVNLIANGGDQYTWSHGLTFTNTNTVTVHPEVSTTYMVTGNKHGCSNSASAVVTVIPVSVLSVNSPTICYRDTAKFKVTGADSYIWSAGVTATGSNTAIATPSLTTTYTVTGITGSCSITATAKVTLNYGPSVTVNSPTICKGDTAHFTVGGSGNTFNWSSGVTLTGSNTAIATPVSTLSYTVNASINGGCSNPATATVTVVQLPSITVNPVSICKGQTASLTAHGGDTYTWPAGLTSTGTNTATVTPDTSSEYTIKGTLAGCSDTTTAFVIVTKPATAAFSYPQTAYCQNDNDPFPIINNGSVAGIFSSAAGLTFVNLNTGQVDLSATAPGTYSVNNIVAPSGGCPLAKDSAALIINSIPVVSYIQNPDTVCTNTASFALSTGNPAGGVYSGQGVSGNVFDPSLTGIGLWPVQYVYVNSNSCKDSVTQYIFVDVCAGIQTLMIGTESVINVFPNPFGPSLTIESTVANGKVVIYNLLGSEIRNWKLQKGKTIFETENLPSGVYFLQIKTEKGMVIKKLLKE